MHNVSPPPRSVYLRALLQRYDTLSLPLGTALSFSLTQVFQPLRLRPSSLEEQKIIAEQERRRVTRQGDETDENSAHVLPGNQDSFAKNGLEALKKSPSGRLVILGGPGTGKTTILKHLLCHHAHLALEDENAPLPIFLSLPDLARTGHHLETYLAQLARGCGLDTDHEQLLFHAIQRGQAFVCLDSLDEVVPRLRPSMIDQINSLVQNNQNRWLVGSRYTDYKGGQFQQGQFQEWEVQTLDQHRSLKFARRLLPLFSEKLGNTRSFSAETFLETLQHDPSIATWSENPLLLSLVALVYAQEGALPGCRASLYHDVTMLMLATRLTDVQEQEQLRALLAAMALHFYQTRGRTFTVSEVEAWLAVHVPNAPLPDRSSLLARILASSLLEKVAEQTLMFQHQMFQEYLVAVALANKLTSQNEAEEQATWDFLWGKHTYSRWSEILRLCVGVLIQEQGTRGTQIAMRWLRRLADEQMTPDGDVGNLCLELALGSLRECPTALATPELADVARSLCLRWGETLANLWVCAKNMRHTRQSSSEERLRMLAREVKTLPLQIILPAIQWMEEARDHGYPGLDADDTERQMTSLLHDLGVALAQEDQAPIPAKVLASAFAGSLERSLSSSVLPHVVRKYAAQERLVSLLQDSQESWRVRAGAAWLLEICEIQAPFIDTVCEVLENQANYYLVRVAAAKALSTQRDRIPIARLVAMLQDRDERIRVVVVSALAATGERMPLEPLLALVDDTDEVRIAVWKALDARDAQIARPFLLAALNDPQASVRVATIKLLGKRIPVQMLLDAFHDPDAEVRIAVLEVAGKMRERLPMAPFIGALTDQEQVYYAAQKALASPGEAASAEMLMALTHEQKLLRRTLATAQHLRIPLPVDFLLDHLGEASHGPYNDAADLLADLGERAPLTTLLDMMRDSSAEIRLGAARALSQLAPSVPTEPLFALLSELDPTEESYSFLVLSLLRKGEHVPVEIVMQALKREWHGAYKEEDRMVSALAALGGQAPFEALLQMIPDGSEVYGWQPDGRAVQVLNATAEWITPVLLQNTSSSKRREDELLALKVLAVLEKDAPADLIKRVLDDQTKDCYLRLEARYALQEAGVHLPLSYLLAEEGIGVEHFDLSTIASVRELGPQAPIQELLALLLPNETDGRHEWWVYETVMKALCEIGPYLPFETLVAALDSHNAQARWGAAGVMRTFGERAPIQKLIALLHDPHESYDVRSVTLDTLVALQPFTPVEALLAILRDPDYHLGREAYRYLEQWGQDLPLEPLFELARDSEYDLRSEAIETLGWLQERAPVDFLLSLLENDEAEVAESAALALSRLGKDAPLEALLAHVHDRDGDLRTGMLESLVSMGEDAPIALFLQTLENEDADVRQDVTYMLDDLAESAPQAFVAAARDDTRIPVREALMRAIAKLGKEAPLDIAIAGLEDENQDVRLYARMALLELEVDPDLIPLDPLLHALQASRDDQHSHWTEFGLLAKLGPRVPVEPLLAELGNSNLDVCEGAAKALYQTHPEVFAEVARQAEAILRGETTGGLFASRVQSRIADRVKWIGKATPAVLAMLSDLLDWPYWQVRMKAAQALGAVRRNIPDATIRRLLELRHDPHSPAVREAADEALAEILSLETGIEDD